LVYLCNQYTIFGTKGKALAARLGALQRIGKGTNGRVPDSLISLFVVVSPSECNEWAVGRNGVEGVGGGALLRPLGFSATPRVLWACHGSGSRQCNDRPDRLKKTGPVRLGGRVGRGWGPVLSGLAATPPPATPTLKIPGNSYPRIRVKPPKSIHIEKLLFKVCEHLFYNRSMRAHPWLAEDRQIRCTSAGSGDPTGAGCALLSV